MKKGDTDNSQKKSEKHYPTGSRKTHAEAYDLNFYGRVTVDGVK